MTISRPEFLENPENRCPVVLVLDTSASMQGTPIEALNEGLAEFKFDVEQDALASLRVEVSLITFGSVVQKKQDFVTIDDFMPPVLTAAGKTPMGEALQLALDSLEERKNLYRAHGVSYYRPWVFLITDGAPTDGTLWQQAVEKVHQQEKDQLLTFFAVGVEGADHEILQNLMPEGRAPFFLKDLKFKELFRWVSASVKRVSMGKVGGGDMMALPPVHEWAA